MNWDPFQREVLAELGHVLYVPLQAAAPVKDGACITCHESHRVKDLTGAIRVKVDCASCHDPADSKLRVAHGEFDLTGTILKSAVPGGACLSSRHGWTLSRVGGDHGVLGLNELTYLAGTAEAESG